MSWALLGAMHRLHVLIIVLVFVIALRGFQVLQLLGVIPNVRTGRSQSEQCNGKPLAPPYKGHLHTAAPEDDNMRSLHAWLRNSGAAVENVQVDTFDGLRGLQAAANISRNSVILAIPTRLCISIGTFAAVTTAAKHPLLTKLLRLPDGDMYLEVLALYHEALLYALHLRKQNITKSGRNHNANSSSNSNEAAAPVAASVGNLQLVNSSAQQPGQQPAVDFGAYLDSLPHSISLPVFLGDTLSSSSGPISVQSSSINNHCQQLLQTLPHLKRLTSKRITGLKQAWAILKPLLKALSKPAAKSLTLLRPCEQYQGFLWAYGMAKTRVLKLEAEAVPGVMGQVLRNLGVDDIGVMVPLLDMANHATGPQVNARVVGDSTAFRLVATQDIKAGEQVLISYNSSDDDSPSCSWRWLLEYAFIPGSSSNDNAPAGAGLPAASKAPQRRCYAFNLTAEAVAKTCMQQQHHHRQNCSSNSPACQKEPDAPHQKQWRQIQQALVSAGLQGVSFWVELDGLGTLPEGLLDWLGQIIAVSTLPGTLGGQLPSQQLQDSSNESHQSDQASLAAICQSSCAADAAGSSGDAPRTLQNDKGGNDKQDEVTQQSFVLQCTARCVLRHIIEEQKQGLQETITNVQQWRQQARGHPNPAAGDGHVQDTVQVEHTTAMSGDSQMQCDEESGSKTTLLSSNDLQQAAGAGSCSSSQFDAASGQDRRAADDAVGTCDLTALLTVAVDGRAALQATLAGLA